MKKRIYGRGPWSSGTPEDKSRCVYEVSNRANGWHGEQCTRKRGYGPNGEYCKQHAKRLEKRQ